MIFLSTQVDEVRPLALPHLLPLWASYIGINNIFGNVMKNVCTFFHQFFGGRIKIWLVDIRAI